MDGHGVDSSYIKCLARAIARAHFDKTRFLKGSVMDKDKARMTFADDWWHYFIPEAHAAAAASRDWHAKHPTGHSTSLCRAGL